MSIQAYQRANEQAESPRQSEYRVFAGVTADLMRAGDKGRADLAGLARALGRNRNMWSILATDCAQPTNALPPALRAQIISLSLWVSRHSSAVLRDGADLAPLIEVNRAIMKGLAPSDPVAAR